MQLSVLGFGCRRSASAVKGDGGRVPLAIRRMLGVRRKLGVRRSEQNRPGVEARDGSQKGVARSLGQVKPVARRTLGIRREGIRRELGIRRCIAGRGGRLRRDGATSAGVWL